MSKCKDVDEAEHNPVDAMKSVFLLIMLCAFYNNAIKVAGADEDAIRKKMIPALQEAKTIASFNEVAMIKMKYLLSIDQGLVALPKKCILDKVQRAL